MDVSSSDFLGIFSKYEESVETCKMIPPDVWSSCAALEVWSRLSLSPTLLAFGGAYLGKVRRPPLPQQQHFGWKPQATYRVKPRFCDSLKTVISFRYCAIS